MRTKFKNGKIFFTVEKDIYNVDVLHKCFYWYGGNFNVEIANHSKKMFSICIEPKNQSENLDEVLEKVKRDLVDFKLRDIVAKETKTVRELIIAKAFAYYDFNDNPTTEVSDPVGFNPLDITTSEECS